MFENLELSGVNLSGANLCRANLSEANPFEANLSEANLDGANLDGISWDDRTSWSNIHNLETAIGVPEALKQLLSQNTPEE